MLNLKEIIQVIYPKRKYFSRIYEKKQIVLHHTVSGKGIRGDVTHWIKSKFNIGTAIIVGRNGDINQLFSSKFWAYHLGIKGYIYRKFGVPYKRLDMNSIGIEIDSYGGLIYNIQKKRWENVYGGGILSENVQHYPNGFRGYYAYEKYTDKQIESVRDLLIYWNSRYGISLNYNEEMWNVSKKALLGTEGVWTHVSFRPDKSDCHPQPNLVSMLRNLV